MVERIGDMPAGTIGLRASGELRLLFVLTDFDGLEAGAVPEDLKTGCRPGSATTRHGRSHPSSIGSSEASARRSRWASPPGRPALAHSA